VEINSAAETAQTFSLKNTMQVTLEIPASAAIDLMRSKPEGVTVEVPGGIPQFRSIDPPDPYVLVMVGTAVSVPAAVLSTWISSKLKKKPPKRATINRRQIDYWEDGTVRQIIEEEINSEAED
jgi:hypothetical protein